MIRILSKMIRIFTKMIWILTKMVCIFSQMIRIFSKLSGSLQKCSGSLPNDLNPQQNDPDPYQNDPDLYHMIWILSKMRGGGMADCHSSLGRGSGSSLIRFLCIAGLTQASTMTLSPRAHSKLQPFFLADTFDYQNLSRQSRLLRSENWWICPSIRFNQRRPWICPSMRFICRCPLVKSFYIL